MREIRWRAEAARKGSDYWVTRDDVVYAGWFYATGNDKPSKSLLEDFELIKTEQDWLDWRLIQETRSFTSEVIA